jgi:tripartite-type tricarboxylate transporter receptor subunit TctC
MTMRGRLIGLLTLLLPALLLLPTPLLAQDYPTRPVKVVVGFPPGGGTDVAARIVTAEMAKSLGQSFLIENKPGAAGTLGAAEVARSAPDGYTLLVTPGGHAIFGAMFKSLPFHTVNSFDWISNIVTIPFFIVVPAGSPFKTLADVVAKAKSAPGTVTFGSTGPGSTHHLGIELLGSRTGAKFLHVPYRGDAPIITALLANELQFSIVTPTQAITNVQAGKFRALATTASTRDSRLPDVPTVDQALGSTGFDVRSWFAMAAPAGTPKPIVDRLNAAVRKAVEVPEVKARLVGMGGEPAATSPKEMQDRVARELATWTKTVEEAGVQRQ